MTAEKLQRIEQLQQELECIVGTDKTLEQKLSILGNSYWRSHHAGYCDYIAGILMSGRSTWETDQHELDWKHRYKVEELLELLTELKQEQQG
ncbi:MAG: hypothetical protein IJD18_04995 [Clostridia bacterium]|nr:hypothetical protein [Clostridia bacterium]MBQ3067370.1 hypothetical protein [Clostridia bacterium]MBR2966888.1 hypothetical protein [Clostridia bacterium]